jgi:tetratricopeptide (TPR) repeat protein
VSPIKFFLGLALLLSCLAAPMSFADEAAEKAAFEQAEMLIEGRRFDDARKLLSATPRESAYARIYGAFVDARLAEDTGRLTTARDAYRKILETHPTLARVRLHLARTLAKLEDNDAARRHYEFVLGAADVTAPYADRVRADMRLLDGAKNWSAHGYVTVAPTSNMTSGASQDVIIIGGLPFTPAAASRRRPGIGAAYGADLSYAAPVSGNWGWVGTLSTVNRDYQGSAYDDRAARASLGARYLVPGGVAMLELVGNRRWFGDAGYQYSFGPLLSTRFFASEKDRVTASASFAEQRYDDARYLNGHRISLAASWDRFTWPGQFVRIGASYDRETARNDHMTFNEFGGLVGYNIETPWALSVYPEFAYAYRAYEGDFPLLNEARRDHRVVGSLSLVKTNFTLFGLAPRLLVSYTYNFSNVKFYEYDRIDAALTLTRGF